MAHRLDIDSIHQNVVLLLNLCYAAETFGRTHDLSAMEESDPVNGPYYVGWLKFTLSEKLIDVAIKTRILLDIVRAEEKIYKEDGVAYAIDSVALDDEITQQYNIGFFVNSEEKVSIREACNKIVHALEIRPLLEKGEGEHVLDEESDVKREWKFWDGSLDLTGSRGKEEWVFTLHISEFCQALDQFVGHIEVNLDWSSIHYDLDVF
jgi:hypothetical protein